MQLPPVPPSPPPPPPCPSDGTRARPRQAVGRRALLGLALALGFAGAAPAQDAGRLTVETRGGPRVFTVELAATPSERARGLMFRRGMPADHGMLFDFATEQPVAFWMKNTPLPLDMIFIDAQGTVAGIAADTVPFSEAPIPSPVPVRAVLEVNAGTAARLGIAVGDRVRHPIFPAP